MMPRNVEVLELIRVHDIDNVMPKTIIKYMPNIKLLMIECLSYKERNSLDNFSKLECLTSCNYCPIRIPRTLKLLAFVFVYGHWAVKSDDLVFTDNVIKSHYEKFTKRISDNSDARDRYILFNDIHYWHLYKCAIQKYFNY
uniref:LRR containing protein n=1 Tax=Strongyloides papillosus TaxID=174720 RepID=A0A0N5BYX8_STREA